jgi:hypothetical protein
VRVGSDVDGELGRNALWFETPGPDASLMFPEELKCVTA